jgi:hypothetical protein
MSLLYMTDQVLLDVVIQWTERTAKDRSIHGLFFRLDYGILDYFTKCNPLY